MQAYYMGLTITDLENSIVSVKLGNMYRRSVWSLGFKAREIMNKHGGLDSLGIEIYQSHMLRVSEIH